MRGLRSFQELLQEALTAVGEGDLEVLRGEAFRQETERQARLAPKGNDPIAQALALGRQALWDLAQGDQGQACQKLSEALRLYPFLGRGLAWELARALCGGGEDAVLPPLEERPALLREALPAVRLLAFLDQLPPGFWAEVLRGERGAASRAAASQEDHQGGNRRPPKPPSRQENRGRGKPPRHWRPERARLPFVYRPLRREGPPEKKELMGLGLLPKDSSLWWKSFEPKALRRWVAPGLEVREEEDGSLHLWVLPEFWEAHPEAALLVLEAEGARALAFLLPTERLLPLPVDLEEGADPAAEVWYWKDLTPEALAGLLQGVRFHLDLLGMWLWYGSLRGFTSQEAIWEALRRLRRGG